MAPADGGGMLCAPMSDATLPGLLANVEAKLADAPFVRCGDDVRTARAFAADARHLAARIAEAAATPGDRVVLLLEHGVDLAVAIFACGLAATVSVVVDPRSKAKQIAHLVADSDARVVVTSARRTTQLRDAAELFGDAAVVDVDDAVAADTPHAARRSPSLAPPSPNDPATILYTSGSTGLPKGIVQTHRNLVEGAAVVAAYLSLRSSDHLLCVLPLSFDYGLNQLLSAAHVGARATLMTYLAPIEVFTAIERHGCTGLAGVPSLWHGFCELLRSGRVDPATCRTLRYVTNSGGRLAVRDIETLRTQLADVSVFSMYGLSEAFRSSYLPPAELARRPTSIGKAVPGVELRVVDPDTGRECGPGEPGELVHAGAFVALGYWRRDADTARVFRADPRDPTRRVVHSGDIVERDADGFLYWIGRRDGLLKVHGHRIAPDQIEQALKGVVGVREAAVLGVPDPASGHRIVAFVSGDDRELPTRARAQLTRELPSHQVPAVVHRLDELPHNRNGKVDYGALRESVGGDRPNA